MRLVGNIERGRGGATGGGSAAASVGVLLINTGSPAAPTEDAVRAYLETFLMDDRIRPLPAPVWRAILQHMVLPRRCPASAAKYASIWTDEGSPLIATSRALAALVENELRCGGVSGDEGGPGGGPSDGLPVRAAMTYGEPGIEEALEGLRATGCHRVVVLPLYPQSAYSTTAAALDARLIQMAKYSSEDEADIAREIINGTTLAVGLNTQNVEQEWFLNYFSSPERVAVIAAQQDAGKEIFY